MHHSCLCSVNSYPDIPHDVPWRRLGATFEAFEKCLNQNAWVAAYFAGLDIGADDAGGIWQMSWSEQKNGCFPRKKGGFNMF